MKTAMLMVLLAFLSSEVRTEVMRAEDLNRRMQDWATPRNEPNITRPSPGDSTLLRDPYRLSEDGNVYDFTPMFQAYHAFTNSFSAQSYPPEPKRPSNGQMGQGLYEMKRREWEKQNAGNTEKRAMWERYSIYYVWGTVLSVTHDGLLISRAGYSQTVFLKNYPRQNNMVDGSSVECAAFASGRYEYTAASGAKRTVIAFDYGEPVPRTDKAKLLQPLPESIVKPSATPKSIVPTSGRVR